MRRYGDNLYLPLGSSLTKFLIQSAVTDCQNPGFNCGQEIGDIIHILAGLGARLQREKALLEVAARAEARAKSLKQ